MFVNRRHSQLPLSTGDYQFSLIFLHHFTTHLVLRNIAYKYCEITKLIFFSVADVMIFKPTTFFIIVQTSFGLELEIQLIPIMQVYIKVDVTYKQKTNGKNICILHIFTISKLNENCFTIPKLQHYDVASSFEL